VSRTVSGTVTKFLVDPNGILPQVIAEMDASGNITSYYVYDGIGLVAKITASGNVYYYHYDGIGTTIAMTDSSGNIVNKYAYDEFGNLLNSVEAISNPFLYVGQYGVMDDDNGLLYMRARYYDPEVGRFISKDPIGYEGGLNLYGYGSNNPENLVDPTGLSYIVFARTGRMGRISVFAGGESGREPPRLLFDFSAGNRGRNPWPTGSYPFLIHLPHLDECGPNTRFGSYGNFVFDVPGHTGMGVHSGHANEGGIWYSTDGCIRISDEAMRSIYALHFGGDRLQRITVIEYYAY
jgi:RHS repeat-associated protein